MNKKKEKEEVRKGRTKVSHLSIITILPLPGIIHGYNTHLIQLLHFLTPLIQKAIYPQIHIYSLRLKVR